jgi:STE24 endopeptidase
LVLEILSIRCAIIPDMENVVIDSERQERAREYARLNRRLMLVGLIFGFVYILAWLFFGWAHSLRDFIMQWTAHPWLILGGFAIIFGGIYFLLNLPLSYYEGFIMPHKYDLSNQTLKVWVTDQLKSLIIGGLLGLLLLQVIYTVLRAYPDTWWLWAAAILLLFTVILSNLAPVLLLPLFYKFSPLEEERQDLAERLKRLAEKAGTRVKGVYKFDMSRRTKAANAALTGLGNTRRILLGDTLLNDFSDDEIETIMAHELGHHVHKDIPAGIMIESILTLGGLYLAHLGLRWGVAYFGFQSPVDPAALPLFILVMMLFGLVTMPLSNAYSRWRERRADIYALKTTGKGDAYASALARLANKNLAEADPEPWVEILLYSHPPLVKRIRMAQDIG